MRNSTKTVYERYKIEHITTPVQHSTSNDQVERVHSTIIELVRCLTKQHSSTSSEEVFNAVKQYNNIIHTVTKGKSVDIQRNLTCK